MTSSEKKEEKFKKQQFIEDTKKWTTKTRNSKFDKRVIETKKKNCEKNFFRRILMTNTSNKKFKKKLKTVGKERSNKRFRKTKVIC